MTFELWPSEAVHVYMCGRETETKGQKDDRRNISCMCFCDSTDTVILQMTLSSS